MGVKLENVMYFAPGAADPCPRCSQDVEFLQHYLDEQDIYKWQSLAPIKVISRSHYRLGHAYGACFIGNLDFEIRVVRDRVHWYYGGAWSSSMRRTRTWT